MSMKRLLLVTVCAALPTLAAAQSLAPEPLPQWRPGPQGDLAFETSAFLRRTAYAKPGKVADQMAPDGAYGPLNTGWEQGTKDHWLIEEQRYAIDAVVAGLSYHRQDLISRGEAIFDWGLRQERPDGAFDCPDRFHSMSFFVEAAAHAALLLQASDMAAQNQTWTDQAAPKLRLAAYWMLAPRNAGPGQAHDAPYTHRFYLDADALGETGVLVHDEGLVRASRDYVRRGLARQYPYRLQSGEGRLGHELPCRGAAVRGDLLHRRGGRRAAGRDAADVDARAGLARRTRAPRRNGRPVGQYANGVRPGARSAGQPEDDELRLGLPRLVLLGDDLGRPALGRARPTGCIRASRSRPQSDFRSSRPRQTFGERQDGLSCSALQRALRGLQNGLNFRQARSSSR